MSSVVEANLIIICGMLPTLRKFFRCVAPKIIGESTYGKETGKSGANWSKPGSGRSPALVTFGSLPSKGGLSHRNKHGGYAEFGSDLDADGYSLDRVVAGCGGGGGPGSDHGILPYDEIACKGRVDTHVEADHPRTGGWDGGDSDLRRSLSRGRSMGRNLAAAGSEESQLPIMGLNGKSQGIKATTRIEVSYVKREPDDLL